MTGPDGLRDIAALMNEGGLMIRFELRWLAVAACVLLGLSTTMAHAIQRSDVTPSDDATPVLTLVHDGESRVLSLADIETLDLYEASLEHFEGIAGVFTGVRLSAFITAHGLDEVRRLRFIAADDYTIFLRPEAIERRDILLVTRFDGEPIPRTQLGPLMLVVPDEAEAVLAGEVTPTDWIWSLIEIRAR